MKCSKCHKNNVNQAKFCSKCGHKLKLFELQTFIKVGCIAIISIILFVIFDFFSAIFFLVSTIIWIPEISNKIKLFPKKNISKMVFSFIFLLFVFTLIVNKIEPPLPQEAEVTLNNYLNYYNYSGIDQRIESLNHKKEFSSDVFSGILDLDVQYFTKLKDFLLLTDYFCNQGTLNNTVCLQFEDVATQSFQVSFSDQKLVNYNSTTVNYEVIMYDQDNNSYTKEYLLEKLNGKWVVADISTDSIWMVNESLIETKKQEMGYLTQIYGEIDALYKEYLENLAASQLVVIENVTEIDEQNISENMAEPEINITLENTSCIPQFLNETKCQNEALMKEYQQVNCVVTWALFNPCDETCSDSC